MPHGGISGGERARAFAGGGGRGGQRGGRRGGGDRRGGFGLGGGISGGERARAEAAAGIRGDISAGERARAQVAGRRPFGVGRGRDLTKFLPKALQDIFFETSFGPEADFTLSTPEQTTESILGGLAFSRQTGQLFGGIRAPRGIEGFLPPEGRPDAGTAARQADFYNLQGAEKAQFIQDVTQTGLEPIQAATRAGVFTTLSFDVPPNIKGTELEPQFLRMMQFARERGVDPGLLGQFGLAVSQAKAPGFEGAPLSGFQVDGMTVGELGQMIGAFSPELEVPEWQEPSGAEWLQEFTRDDPKTAYFMRLRDFLSARMDAGEMTKEEANRFLDQAGRDFDRIQFTPEELPFWEESKNVFGAETDRFFAEHRNRLRLEWEALQRQWFGGGGGAAAGRGAGGVDARVGAGRGSGGGGGGVGGGTAGQTAQNVRGLYFQYVQTLGLSQRSEAWMNNQFSILFNIWDATASQTPFMQWLVEYLATNPPPRGGFEERRLAPPTRGLRF